MKPYKALDNTNIIKPLVDLLKPKRITEIVDIEVNPIDGDPPYKPMLMAGVIFELLVLSLKRVRSVSATLV